MTAGYRSGSAGTLVVGLTILASLPLGLAACSTTATESDSPPSATTAPPLEGPWADEFTAEWKAATRDFERQILEDGAVSDQEYAEMTERFRACLADESIDFDGFEPDGSYETTNSFSLDQDAVHEAVNACSSSSGEDSVGLLYAWVNRNPENLDDNSIVVECLQDAGVVDRAYTAEQYAGDIELESYPFIVDTASGRDSVAACESDPLGLLGLRP